MKRKLAIFLMVAMLLSTLSLFSVSADDGALTFSNPLDSHLSTAGGGTHFSVASSSANTFITNGSLQVKAIKNYARTRHTSMISLIDQTTGEAGVLPVGTYTVSLWMRSNPASTGDWASVCDGTNTTNTANRPNSELAISFYGIGVTDASIATDAFHADDALASAKLISLDNSTYELDTVFTKNESNTTTSGTGTAEKTWYQYTAEVTFTEPCESFAFWMLNNGTAEKTDWFAYIENVELVLKTPAVHDEGVTFRGVQTSALSDESDTFNTRLVSTLDTLSYASVGYDITITAGETTKSKTFYLSEVYDTLTGSTDTGIALEYRASYYNAGGIAALTVTNLPDTGTVTVLLTPFTVGLAAGSQPVEANTYLVTYVDGVCTGIVTNPTA